jgi:hypothetical protein
MKNKFLILIMLVTAISFVAVHKVSAQTTATQLKGMTPPQRADFQTQLMKTKLNLDARQIVQVKAINLKYAYKFQPILTSDDGRTSKAMKSRALQQQKDLELKGVFTPSQFTQYKGFESDLQKQALAQAGN